MASPLLALEPQSVWTCFDGIRQVPRPSKHEERISRHVLDWAAGHGFETRADRAGNLVVTVPASPGRESSARVVLQAHLDMVCEKNAGVVHDFMQDPIRVAVEDGWVTAVGTTLGADNGLGVAAAMAAAVDSGAEHGPLELLFTLDEETGLHGASALDPAIVEGRQLINLDTEEDDAVYIGCAGASGAEATFTLERAAAGGSRERFTLAVRGLRGGHSGIDIVENRGNAVKVAARLLVAAIDRGVDLRLVAFDGGSKRNAIARECFVHLALDPGERAGLEEVLTSLGGEVADELYSIDPGLELELSPAPPAAPEWHPLIRRDRDRLLRAIVATPHGVLAMSREVPGLVETSCNLARVSTDEGGAGLLCSVRSSVNASLAATLQALRSVFSLAGAEVAEESGYPGWKPNPDSSLVRRTVRVYERLFSEPPAIKAVHAGLECGILAQKIPGLDAVSIGPDIRNPHSPDEKVSVPSVARFYSLLKELLADLAGSS